METLKPIITTHTPDSDINKSPLANKIDAYLRRSETILAQLNTIICPLKGEEYLNSHVKKMLDISVAVPAAIIATPIITVLGIAKKLEDGGTALFKSV